MFIPLTRPRYDSQTRFQSGFSLVELLVVISIIAILVMMAVPNLKSTFNKRKNDQVTQTMVAAFREARTESQLRRQDIQVKATAKDITLQTSGSGAKTIRQFLLNPNTGLDNPPKTIIFKSNKSVQASGTSSTATSFTYQVVCNVKDVTKGSKVIVDNNGNVKIDNGGSKC